MILKKFLQFFTFFLFIFIFSPALLSQNNTQPERLSFANYYSYTPLSFTAKVPQYKLPLDTKSISNFNDFIRKIPLEEKALDLLKKNGFVVVDNPFYNKEDDITAPYETIKDQELPVFITTDSLLHLYHIQFDETLRQIEEKEFYNAIWEISKTLLDKSLTKYKNYTGDVKEALRRDIAYLSVALSLLQPKESQLCQDEYECSRDPGIASAYFTKEDLKKYTFTIPELVRGEVEAELGLIEEHKGFSKSPIFIYKEDYSQYVPRGHYTRSERLKNYFKAFTWYGRMSMLLEGTDQVEKGMPCDRFFCKALISNYDAKVQTIQALLIASMFNADKDIFSKWERIYNVTAFYVGFSDDLGPYEYIEALNYVFNGNFTPEKLTDENLNKIKIKLAEYSSPKIYGGTGELTLKPPFTPEQVDEILGITKGFRLMGQRFIPDSYMFTELVLPSVGMFIGDNCNKVFTCGVTQVGPARVFPRGLDVMALLGSRKALELLEEYEDIKYEGYDIQLNKLNQEFSVIDEYEWQKNLYWSWLYSLKALLEEFGQGYPTFMKTDAWQTKTLTTTLASWTELRHDTILYAKQSYTLIEESFEPEPEKPVVGYVEAVPEFYNRLLALTRMTNKGLSEMNVLDESAKGRLNRLENILNRLVNLSIKELNNEELTSEDYDFIKYFGGQLEGVIADVDEKAKKTTIVADVHTDQNTGRVLEEGVGYVRLLIAAYLLPDGRILVGAGPTMSYYEFKHPISDRLTDEKWRGLLSTNPPAEPEWTADYRIQNQ